MILDDVQSLRQRFADEWESDVPVFYDLQPNDQRPLNAPYVHFSVRPGSSNHAGGSNTNGFKKQLGRVWLQLFVPPQTGDAVALALIEAFADIFRNWNDGTIQCGTEELGSPLPDKETDLIMFTVSIPWESWRSY